VPLAGGWRPGVDVLTYERERGRMAEITVHASFSNDLRELLAAKLVSDGYEVAPTEDLDAVLVKFLNVQHRRIPPRRRGVVWSKELRTKGPTLTADQRAALARIEAASMAGADMNPYLSRRLVRSAAFNDMLLNDWSIQHMHLGDGLNAEGLVRGTKELLFVIAKADTLYYVNVLDHAAFSDDQLFTIAETNWPHLFQHVALKSALGLEREVSSAERAELRAAGINVFTVGSSGTVFAPAGGGSVTTGTSISVRRAAMHLLDEMRRREKDCHEHSEPIAKKVAEKTGKALTELHLKLEMADDGKIRIVETQTGFVL
jgi:hypothetical protein